MIIFPSFKYIKAFAKPTECWRSHEKSRMELRQVTANDYLLHNARCVARQDDKGEHRRDERDVRR